MANSFTADVIEIVEDYSSKVKGVAEECTAQAAKDTARRLRNVTNPRLTGEYAKGWAVKKKASDTYIVYNKTAPGLTHLLENGHAVANQYGNYGHPNGRVKGIKHIEPAAEEGAAELIAEVERRL